MKVIFLDFDGVLNSRQFLYRDNDGFDEPSKMLNPEKVKMISDLAQTEEANIVISSAWRRIHSIYDLRNYLAENGMEHVGDITKIDMDVSYPQRGDFIEAWLDEHPEVTDYVVFDDDNDMDAIPSERFVWTSFAKGLQEHHILQAKKALNHEE